MLDRTNRTTVSTTTAAVLQTRRLKHLTAQNIAKADRPAAVRAWLADQWIKGVLLIDTPTAAAAAAIFGCSAGSVHRAVANSAEDPVTTVDLLLHHWQRASREERAAFGRAAGVSVLWDGAISPNI